MNVEEFLYEYSELWRVEDPESKTIRHSATQVQAIKQVLRDMETPAECLSNVFSWADATFDVQDFVRMLEQQKVATRGGTRIFTDMQAICLAALFDTIARNTYITVDQGDDESIYSLDVLWLHVADPSHMLITEWITDNEKTLRAYIDPALKGQKPAPRLPPFAKNIPKEWQTRFAMVMKLCQHKNHALKELSVTTEGDEGGQSEDEAAYLARVDKMLIKNLEEDLAAANHEIAELKEAAKIAEKHLADCIKMREPQKQSGYFGFNESAANPYTLRRGGGLETDAPFGLHKLVPKSVRDDFRRHALLTPDAASKVMLSEYKQMVQWLVKVDEAETKDKIFEKKSKYKDKYETHYKRFKWAEDKMNKSFTNKEFTQNKTPDQIEKETEQWKQWVAQQFRTELPDHLWGTPPETFHVLLESMRAPPAAPQGTPALKAAAAMHTGGAKRALMQVVHGAGSVEGVFGRLKYERAQLTRKGQDWERRWGYQRHHMEQDMASYKKHYARFQADMEQWKRVLATLPADEARQWRIRFQNEIGNPIPPAELAALPVARN